MNDTYICLDGRYSVIQKVKNCLIREENIMDINTRN